MIAEETQVSMIKVLKLFNINDSGTFQGFVCDLLSAYIFSTSLKILQLSKVPQDLVDEICENHIAMALDYAKAAKHKILMEH